MQDNKNSKIFELEEYESRLSYSNSKINLNISFNRIAFIFFIFLGIAIIFSIKSIYLGSLKKHITKNISNDTNFRSSILDRNGNIIAKTVFTTNVGINPNLIIDKRLLINLRLIFQDKNIEQFEKIEKKLNSNKFFYIKKKISQDQLEQVLLLGDKSIILEEKISRIYPQKIYLVILLDKLMIIIMEYLD